MVIYKQQYLPTIITSSSEAFFLKCVHRSMANIVLLLLNIEVSDDIRADNITANIIPRAPVMEKKKRKIRK